MWARVGKIFSLDDNLGVVLPCQPSSRHRQKAVTCVVGHTTNITAVTYCYSRTLAFRGKAAFVDKGDGLVISTPVAAIAVTLAGGVNGDSNTHSSGADSNTHSSGADSNTHSSGAV